MFAAAAVIPAIPAYAEETSAYDDELVTFIVETDGRPAAEYTAVKNSGRAFFSSRYDEDYISENLLAENTEIMETAAEALEEADTSASFVYTRLFSGFTITARRGDMDKLLETDGVVGVSEDGELYAIEDDLTDGNAATAAAETVDGYKGQGTAVAVIDSGFDLDHPYFNASVSEPKYTEADITAAISKLTYNDGTTRGKYYSEKIPFTYDYNAKSSDDEYIGDDAEHGTHVAGIAAGKNGVISNGDTINGAAPEAQLLLMACAKANGSMSYSVVAAALDDAAALGADVINMSLGSDYYDVRSGFSTVLTAVKNARNAGITVAVSSGNASRGFYDTDPSVLNPDYGAQGMFAKDTNTFSVASANIPKTYFEISQLILGDGAKVPGNNVEVDENQYFTIDFTSTFTTETEYVDCGYGQESDFSDKELTNKIALIMRGNLSFEDKTNNAKKAGAAGVIIINTDDEYFMPAYCTLPTMLVTKTTGDTLLACEKKTVYVSGTSVGLFELLYGNQPSSFTSWGVTETLELTPNITAYGGYIYSAQPGGSYQLMNGTSMSSPYIAGAAACVKSYLNTMPFGELTGVNTADLISQLLMSTAEPLTNPPEENSADPGLPYSPRQQGAGLVQTDKAISTPVVLYNDNGKTLVNLGDELKDSFNLSFTVKNYSNSEITFDTVSVKTVTDGAAGIQDDAGNITNTIFYGTSGVNSTIQSNLSVTVPANGTAAVSIPVQLESEQLEKYAAVFTNGFYIDGFVRLSNDTYSVGLPFMGFRGDWGSVPLWDKTIHDDGGSELYDGTNGSETYLYTTVDGEKTRLKDNYILSPNGDGKSDTISAAFALHRASDKIKLELAASDGSAVLTETKPDRYSKYLAYDLSFARDLGSLPDGDYTFRLTGYADDGDGTTKEQTLIFPIKIKIDHTAPAVTMTLSEDNKLTVKAIDDSYVKSVTVSYRTIAGEDKSETVSLSKRTSRVYETSFTLDTPNPTTVSVTAADFEDNSAVYHDLTIPMQSGGDKATMFKRMLTSDSEVTYTRVSGTVKSVGVSKSFDRAFDTQLTIAGDSSCIFGLIVQGLYDAAAELTMTLE